ncbi:uncharacterized protein BO66DRAFT_158171 [Aspergillus aculeatinus CBS 121060]|uniref:Uncharacterized protein n=1 Tax=Aspergillus aculeatinus CBS 121060 TaxID=1448322 RepID=A0ACD1H1G6_9EURO|nr:hypothetical protein BO66DRAFT_158171 [Aspergillus aculeatinus CBS 121060]RAH67265.1 hypothetical protein BO66DRAFT_158171 [Aspergillus aculeatinus CBS 121060]
MACSNLADELILPIQQVLLGLLLASANVYIVQNGHRVEECASMWGGVVLDLDSDDPVCYTLEIPGSGASNTDISIPLSGNVSDLIYSTYKINQTALVRSSLQCQSTNNRYHAAYTPLTTVIPGSGYSTSSLPSCFFNLPVLYTNYAASMNSSREGISGTPCQVRGGTPADGVGHHLPSNLAAVFTGEFCTCTSTAPESLS